MGRGSVESLGRGGLGWGLCAQQEDHGVSAFSCHRSMGGYDHSDFQKDRMYIKTLSVDAQHTILQGHVWLGQKED